MHAHPLKATLAKALDLAETFAGDVEFLTLDKNLSAEGRNNARRAKLKAAIRDLRDARAPINELQAKLDKKRAAVAIPPFDPKDVVGFLRRQELRAALRTMETGPRELLLKDPAFADAMLEQPAVLSGLFLADGFEGTASPEIQRDREIVAAAKQRRLETLFAPQLAEIEELEKTVTEANMIADLALDFNRAQAGYSPDRVDALVWALTELLGEAEAPQPCFGVYGSDGIRMLYRHPRTGDWVPQR
jgi:hypothetical protein